jgi:hypothetical protein
MPRIARHEAPFCRRLHVVPCNRETARAVASRRQICICPRRKVPAATERRSAPVENVRQLMHGLQTYVKPE